MPNDNFPSENDVLLIPFLSSANDEEAELCLNQLFEETVIPQIRKTLSSHLTLLFDERDEIKSDVQARVLIKLRKLRASLILGKPITNPINDFAAYVSTVTFNCRKDYLLRKQPEWRRIGNRLRRLRDERSEMQFYVDDDDIQLICLKSQAKKHSELKMNEIISIVCERYPNHLFLKTQVLVPVILDTANGALTKNELIKAILKITDSGNFQEIELSDEMTENLKINADEDLISKRQKVYLRRIWEEVKTFPTNQRKVLILSLKETGKVEVITLLLKKRIATIEEIADALELSLKEFSDVFFRLPMSSSEIADFLGIEGGEKTSKQQKVDNLRSIARNLLRKRLGIRKNV